MPDCIRSTDLLLLPGMMCDELMWQQQIDDLSPFTSVLVGDIGHSNSVETIARTLLEEAPPRFALAGLSMGGIVALEMWRQAPHRIERLALLDTNFRQDTADRRHVRDKQIMQVQQGLLRDILRDELKPRYLAQCNRSNLALLDDLLRMGERLGEEVFVRQSLALRDRPDSTQTLATISCPTLVICGEEDELCPVELHREMAQRIRGATLRVIENCGHICTMEQPNEVSVALAAWLKET
ncbi:MAG: alpha/beta fold hydrolase [Halioglobus sp.]